MAQLCDLKYPLEIDATSGSLKLAYDHEVRQQNIKCLIETIIFERVLFPDYGTPLYLFEVISNLNLVNFKIKESIIKYVPNVEVEVTSQINQEGHFLVQIDWVYLINNDRVLDSLNFDIQL